MTNDAGSRFHLLGRRVGVAVAAVALASVAFAMPSKAIVGGQVSPAGANPFMASVQSGGYHFCGGSVISARWVLTAAHCVEDGKAAGLSVVVGTNDNANGSGTRITVDQVKVHPAYGDNRNDAALLHLVADAPVPAITLAGPADDYIENDGSVVTVAGWGDINPVTLGLLAPAQMRQVNLKVVGDSRCADGDDVRMCAEALGKDSCQGDSGGPLFATVGSKRVQVGIVSYGLLCAIPTQPGVYSEVNSTSVRSFIRTNSGV